MAADVLVLDKSYQPHFWVSKERAILFETRNVVIDHLGEDIIIFHGGTNKQGNLSEVKTSSIIVVNGQPPYNKHRSSLLTNESLFRRDLQICAYCGIQFKPHQLTRDHYHPQSKGGEDHWGNVLTACKGCNGLKGNMLPGSKLPRDFNGRQILGPQGDGYMSPLYVPYVPCSAEHLILKNRSIKADQMEFLLSMIKSPKSRIHQQILKNS